MSSEILDKLLTVFQMVEDNLSHRPSHQMGNRVQLDHTSTFKPLDHRPALNKPLDHRPAFGGLGLGGSGGGDGDGGEGFGLGGGGDGGGKGGLGLGGGGDGDE